MSSQASCSSEASTVILDDSFSETPSKILRRESPREAAKTVSNFVIYRITNEAYCIVIFVRQLDHNCLQCCVELYSQMVNHVLLKKPGGEKIFQEYHKTKSLTATTRRLLVNILVADMVEVHGYVSRAFGGKCSSDVLILFYYN